MTNAWNLRFFWKYVFYVLLLFIVKYDQNLYENLQKNILVKKVPPPFETFKKIIRCGRGLVLLTSVHCVSLYNIYKVVIFSAAQSGHSRRWWGLALKALSCAKRRHLGWTCFIAMLNFPLPLRNNLSLRSSISNYMLAFIQWEIEASAIYSI